MLASWVAPGTPRRFPVLAVRAGTTLLRTPAAALVLGSFVITCNLIDVAKATSPKGK